MFLAGQGLQAQEMEYSVFFNGLLPVAEFNNKVDLADDNLNFVPMNRENIGTGAMAGLGGTVRVGVWFDLGFGELMPYVDASLLWNTSKSAVRNAYDENQAKAPSYFNVPLTLGFKYRYDINDILRPFAEIGIGYDMFFATRSYGVNDRWYKFKPSGSVSWEMGLGTYLGNNVSVGLYYLGLGSHRIEYASTSTGREDGSTLPTIRRTIGELALRIGFHF